jgi:hypothetical protein
MGTVHDSDKPDSRQEDFGSNYDAEAEDWIEELFERQMQELEQFEEVVCSCSAVLVGKAAKCYVCRIDILEALWVETWVWSSLVEFLPTWT